MPAKKKPAKTNKEFEKLLSLVIAFTQDKAVSWNDLCMRHKSADSLRQFLKKNRRYMWVKQGQSMYLYDAADASLPAQAYILVDSPRKVRWTVCGAGVRSENGDATSVSRAKSVIEKRFSVVQD